MCNRSLTILENRNVTDAVIMTIYQHGAQLCSFTFRGSITEALAWAKSIGYQDIRFGEGSDERPP